MIGVAVAFLGMLPGKIAKGRNHPQAEAINVASWLGIITLGVLWPFALIWAYIRPSRNSLPSRARRSSPAWNRESKVSRNRFDGLGGTP